jgi:RimJ/RimL family protein N-acetyltransferase
LADDHRSRQLRRAELGFWCAAAARGSGVITAAGRAVCTWGLETLRLDRIEWLAEVGNEASWRAAHQIGFAFEGRALGRLRGRDGEPVDAWVGAIRPGEVAAQRVLLPWGPDPVLAAGATTVRRWQLADIDHFTRMQGEQDVLFWSGREPGDGPSRPDAVRLITQTYAERWMTGTSATFAVLDDEQVVGGVGINRRHQRLGELSWWLGSAHRGRGTATNAVDLVARWASSIGLERLEARVHVDNAASVAVAERVGMRREGRLADEAPYLRTYPLRSTRLRGPPPEPVVAPSWGDAFLFGLLTGDLR